MLWTRSVRVRRTELEELAKSIPEALSVACYKRLFSLAAAFITAGADVNARDRRGMCPLHHVAMYGDVKLAKLLIAKGADVNARITMSDIRPVSYAGLGGNREMISLLESLITQPPHHEARVVRQQHLLKPRVG